MQITGLLTRFRRLLERLYIERDFFHPFEILLALPGFHLVERFRKRSWMRVLFVLTRVIQLLQYALWVDRFYLELIDSSGSSEKTLHYGNTLSALTMMLVRMFVVHWYMPNVEEFKRYLRRQRRLRVTKPNSGTHRISYRKIVNIAIMFQLVGLADRLVFCFSSTYRQELYELPSNLVELGWPMVIVLHVVSFDFESRWIATYSVSITGMNSIMMGLYDELVDIAEEYQELFARSKDDSSEFWSCLERNIVQAVKRHEAFISQLDQLKPFLQATFLVMFYSAALFLAVGTLLLITNGMTVFKVIFSGFLFALLLECYWCCQLVDRLNDMNAQIGMHLYSLPWTTELQYTIPDDSRYRQVRLSLLIMMSKTQKSLEINCGGMFEMSREAFASLVKLAYTMLMFLRDTQNFS